MFFSGIEEGGFEPTETEVPETLRTGEGEGKSVGVAFASQFFNLGSAGVRQPQGSCHFVKSLSYGVVLGFAKKLHGEGVLHLEKVGVSTCCHQHQKGIVHWQVSQFQREDVGLEVVYADEGDGLGGGKRPSEGVPNKEGTYQSGSFSCGYSLQVLRSYPCLPERFLNG